MDAVQIAQPLDDDQQSFRSDGISPALPTKDNQPGAPELLRKANEFYRNAAWPSPYNQTSHSINVGDARDLSGIADESVHLVVTSPPYFDLKEYASDAGGRQLGRFSDYEKFLNELDRVWSECRRVLVPGGRICCVIGDILIPRRVDGRHRVLPLPADIQVRSRKLGLDNLTPILWFKIGNRTNEAGGGSSGYYGKPYQPGAIIKNDHEHILLLRKPGGYRNTPMIQKALSMLQRAEVDAWMRPVWHDIKGASLRNGHPAPFPVELAERLIRMFSFAGDTVLDPFLGSGSTSVAAIGSGRSSIGVDIEPTYVSAARKRVEDEISSPYLGVHFDVHEDSPRRDGGTWIEHFQKNLDRISIRRAPLWNQGLIEASWVIQIDSQRPEGARLVDPLQVGADSEAFFGVLLQELFLREPTLQP